MHATALLLSWGSNEARAVKPFACMPQSLEKCLCHARARACSYPPPTPRFPTPPHSQTGDVFLSAACIAYYGAFTRAYRQQLVAEWIAEAGTRGIPVSTDCTLRGTLASPVEVCAPAWLLAYPCPCPCGSCSPACLRAPVSLNCTL